MKAETEQTIIKVATFTIFAVLVLPIVTAVGILFMQHPLFFLTQCAIWVCPILALNLDPDKLKTKPAWLLGSMICFCSCLVGLVWVN